jgi:ASC-1-like (ASCH) protein
MSFVSINVQEPYFSFIKEEKKTVEGRLNKGKFSDIKVGDICVINNKIEVEVIGKRHYKTFQEMISVEGIKKVIPNVDSIEEAVAVYYKFYTKEKEIEHGVIAIEIKILKIY